MPGVTRTAFVLGGGGLLGAAEAGMARALVEAGIVPDLIFGTSIGAINGAAIAADPTPSGVEGLDRIWQELGSNDVFGGSPLERAVEIARNPTALHSPEPLRRLLRDRLAESFEELRVPFECVAASIEHAREHWFTSGPLEQAVLASCALPGVFPPVCIDGEHFFDGGLVDSIPLGRAVSRGADTIWVLHVGRIEEQLSPPRYPWQVGFVAFEIARRHRFHGDLLAVPERVTVHVLPTGRAPGPARSWSNLRYRARSLLDGTSERAYRATRRYLQDLQDLR